MTPTSLSPTAEHLRTAIAATSKTQREIARDAGLPHPNVLSMMKTGETKIPINRIPALAAALGVDAAEFVEIAMREYNPEIWATLVATAMPPLGSVDRKLLAVYHNASFGLDVPWSDGLEAVLYAIFEWAGTLEAARRD